MRAHEESLWNLSIDEITVYIDSQEWKQYEDSARIIIWMDSLDVYECLSYSENLANDNIRRRIKTYSLQNTCSNFAFAVSEGDLHIEQLTLEEITDQLLTV